MQHRLLPVTGFAQAAGSCSSARQPHAEQSSHLPALPEIGRASGQGPDAERLAAAYAEDRRGGGQLHCAIRFQQRCLGLHLVADQGSYRHTLAVLKDICHVFARTTRWVPHRYVWQGAAAASSEN